MAVNELLPDFPKKNPPKIIKAWKSFYGRLGISVQILNKEFFLGVLVTEVDKETWIKRSHKTIKVKKGNMRVLDMEKIMEHD